MDEPQPSLQRRNAGTALRQATKRAGHGEWHVPSGRADPVQVLIDQGRTRIQDLLPLRYGRMQGSAFAFLRGAAAVMAADLASTPQSGLRVQACGDCHLANFGAYRSPEGSPVFDINDFDETLPAPFEWDLKRLATSLVVAGQDQHLPDRQCGELARAAAAAYRTQMASLSLLSPLQAWTARISLPDAVASIQDPKLRAREATRLEAAMTGTDTSYGLVERTGTGWSLRTKPGIRRLDEHELAARALFERYAETLAPERQQLFRRFALRDIAFKAVGVGSVGTFCAIGLFTTGDGEPLLLQVKEATRSVLAAYAGESAFAHQGQRVVVGQRTMQAVTDIFLGWTDAGEPGGRHFYVRQLKDPKLAAIGEDLTGALPFYAPLCGRTLARAHARSGDAAMISGYLGRGDAMDEAVAQFALSYAKQTRLDWQAMLAAIKAGRITAAAS